MEGEALRAGKEKVKAIVINPLVARGMARRSSQKVAEFEAMQESLAARLAYMDEGNLIVLAEMIERLAEGKSHNLWPAEVTICNWARKLQPPPPSESRLVRSYLQSGAGHRAYDEGYLVELFEYLKRMGIPPTSEYALTTIRDKAMANARQRLIIAERMANGSAEPLEQGWLRAYNEQLARCKDIMNSKDEAAA